MPKSKEELVRRFQEAFAKEGIDAIFDGYEGSEILWSFPDEVTEERLEKITRPIWEKWDKEFLEPGNLN